ncbi:hypothetical protein P9D34_12005 [Bacillus swezeyi]|uniref:YqgU-like 6-bladed beta-propeller domain-containing protein n=1 Tax=Bacillus swezeyi TaxID=1925020 RepID=A0A1R1QB35_9BACI|nr:hypothetical protein [Bacillus swezeyi]MEC1261166.1 hypothetical protein [Bacillus swezeyi]MED2929363.1 hypothetical protein [Bacillus swezeyi]MED2941175.1 hypothetical protein [Bacillus swezeyi]MED2963610.1 hypothetical protein [Bacillus swezeyi]MED3073684.1 hypothetical protein [Bacillus swezeyi]
MAGLRVSLWIIAAVMTGLTAACAPLHKGGSESVFQDESEGKRKSDGEVHEKKIIALNDRRFDETAGWLDNETILYTRTDPIAGSEVRSYDIFKGAGETIYKTDDRLISAELNREKGMILIQTMGNDSEIKLTLINLQGEQLFEKRFHSHELQVDWNEYDPYLLYVTAFTKDWNFDSFLINAKEDKTEKDVAQAAFIHWTSSSSFEYIKWNNQDREKPAPVYSNDINAGREKKVADDAILLDVFKNLRMIVTSSADSGNGTYIFSDVSSSKKRLSFTLPLFSQYSSLSPAEYSYDDKNELFYTYQPSESSSLFDLIAINLRSGERQVIRKHAEMLPITISPDGEYALYGYTQNEIISLGSKKSEPLVIKE